MIEDITRAYDAMYEHMKDCPTCMTQWTAGKFEGFCGTGTELFQVWEQVEIN